VLFLDEPVSALDPAGRKEVLELIEQMQGKCTVFMSTHILGDVERVCDSVGIINRGKMVTIGPRQELLERYAVPAIEIGVEPVYKERLAAWMDGLRSLSWVKSTVLDEAVLRVVVSDLETAKVQLLASALQAGLVLERYEVVRPSLEDVFLQLVSQPVQTAPGQTSPEGRPQ
jgi:ABC-2 type transport system ATP-binding protein